MNLFRKAAVANVLAVVRVKHPIETIFSTREDPIENHCVQDCFKGEEKKNTL